MALPALQVRVPNPANALLQAEQIKGARAQSRAFQRQEAGQNALLTAFQNNDFTTPAGQQAIIGQVGQVAPTRALELQERFGRLNAQDQAKVAQEGRTTARALVGVRDQASYTQALSTLPPQISAGLPPQYDPQVVQSTIQQAQTIDNLTVSAGTQAQISAADARTQLPTPPLSEARQAQQLAQIEARRAPTATPDPQDQFKNANTLRDEFVSQTNNFAEAQRGLQKVQAAANDNTGAGDVALIFGFMKTIDPGSTVREGEFATAENTGSIDERTWGLYNNLVRGDRLTPSQRERFAATAASQFEAQRATYDQTVAEYTRLAESFGLPPANVVVDRALATQTADPATGDIRPSLESMPRPTTQEGYDALPAGAWYIDPDSGQPARKGR